MKTFLLSILCLNLSVTQQETRTDFIIADTVYIYNKQKDCFHKITIAEWAKQKENKYSQKERIQILEDINEMKQDGTIYKLYSK